MKAPSKYFDEIDKLLELLENSLDALADEHNIGLVDIQFRDVLDAVDKLKKAMTRERFTNANPRD